MSSSSTSMLLDPPTNRPAASRHQRVAAVIPAYNEEGKIGRVLRKIPPGIVDAIIVVDDCSRDRTSEEARAGGAIVLRHDVNQGVGAGIRTGIDYARQNGFDAEYRAERGRAMRPDSGVGIRHSAGGLLDLGKQFCRGAGSGFRVDCAKTGHDRLLEVWFNLQAMSYGMGVSVVR